MPICADIARDIATREGQCVLLLGPELSVNKEGKYYKSYFKELEQQYPSDIIRYFESENIFSFKDDLARDRQIDAIRYFYRDVGDTNLLHLIAQIQFPLIINVCPDKSLNEIYDTCVPGYIYDYRYADMSERDDRDIIEIPRPTKAKPIIYNLFGDWEVTQSLVYDHATLYRAIEELLPRESIPAKIRAFLNTANSFVFLGFDFDSWHYQLVCHKLGLGKASVKKSYGSPDLGSKKNNVGIVMANYFKVNFIDHNPTTTIEEIIKACKELPNTLRNLEPADQYGVYISYAWKDKKVDILEMFDEILSSDKTDTAKLEKVKMLLKQSGKIASLSDEELLELLTKGMTNDNVPIEEWYKDLPVNNELPGEANDQSTDREYFVDELEKALTEKGVQVFRDRNEITYGDSVDSFMNRIGTGKAVIRVVSDKYLKSRYCMDEALRIKRYSTNNTRIFTVVLKNDIEKNIKTSKLPFEDINLDDRSHILYMKYWETLIENVYEKINTSGTSVIDKERIKKYYSVYIDIYDYLIPFMKTLQDELHLEVNKADYKNCISIQQDAKANGQASKLNEFVEAIVSKLKSS